MCVKWPIQQSYVEHKFIQKSIEEKHYWFRKKAANSVLLHKSCRYEVCCCYSCFYVKISNRRIVSRACRNFFRVVFSLVVCFFFLLFLVVVIVAIIIIVGGGSDGGGGCCSITCVCVCVLWINISALGDLCLFCGSHSPIHAFEAMLSRFRIQNAISTVAESNGGGVMVYFFGGRIIRIALSKIYRTESLFASSHSRWLSHQLSLSLTVNQAVSQPTPRREINTNTIFPMQTVTPLLNRKPHRIHSRDWIWKWKICISDKTELNAH